MNSAQSPEIGDPPRDVGGEPTEIEFFFTGAPALRAAVSKSVAYELVLGANDPKVGSLSFATIDRRRVMVRKDLVTAVHADDEAMMAVWEFKKWQDRQEQRAREAGIRTWQSPSNGGH